MKYIPIIILSILISGCSLFSKNSEPSVLPAKSIQIDSAALEPCQLLKPDVVIGSFDALLEEYGNLATLYGGCANKQSNSIIIIKKFGGMP